MFQVFSFSFRGLSNQAWLYFSFRGQSNLVWLYLSFRGQSNLAWLFGHKQQPQFITMKKKGKKKEVISDLDDPRFAQMVNDPRFRTMRSQEKKVKIDDRFQGMFSERRFTGGHRVDKRGLPIRKPQGEHLEDHYELDSGVRDEGKKPQGENLEDHHELDSGVRDEGISSRGKSGTKVPDARGLDSDIESSSSDEESEEEEEEEGIDHDWG